MEQLRALGYVDPGAGSSMWQIMLAGFFGVSARIKKFFLRRNSKDQED